MKSNRIYLDDIQTSILRIQEYTKDGKERFYSDTKSQDAVARNFEIIGEVVKRLPNELLAQQPHIPWRAIAGFRDVLIHDYDSLDLDEIWLTIEKDLPLLLQAIQELMSNLET